MADTAGIAGMAGTAGMADAAGRPINTPHPTTPFKPPTHLDVVLRVGLQGVHHVRELHAVADEEDLQRGAGATRWWWCWCWQ